MGIVEDIKSLKIQSASTIALEGLKYLKKVPASKFEKEAKRLENARPTAVVLHNVIEDVREGAKINDLIKELKKSKALIAKNGKRFFKGKVVMTHCHSTEAIGILKKARPKHVYVTETEPREQGVQTAKDLAKAKIKVTLIIDSAKGFFIDKVDNVLVGSDSLRKIGVANKIGTLPHAIIANEFNVPFFVTASMFKIDRRHDFVIEERDPNEVHKKIRGVKIENPAFDITPWRYITSVITDKGVKKPRQILEMLR